MKKSLKFFAAAALVAFAAVACQKEESRGNGAEGIYTFEVSADNIATKATIDEDGKGTAVNRFIMEVYLVKPTELVLLDRKVQAPTGDSPKRTSFNLTLIKDQEYKVLFWADKGTDAMGDLYYKTTDNLQNVSFLDDARTGNNDALDAFSKMEVITRAESKAGFSKSVQLTRPFGQVNFITTDIPAINALTGGSNFLPTRVRVNYTTCTGFNVLTQTGTGSETINYTTDVYSTKDTATNPAKYTLSMDYMLTATSEKETRPVVKLTALAGNYELTTVEVTNYPVQRNYRTNIIGNLLTEQSNYTITVDANWNTPEIPVADNIAAVNEILASPSNPTNIEVAMSPDANTVDVTFTSNNDNQDLTMSFKGDVAGNTLTFSNDSSAEGPASLNVEAPSGTNLVFETPMTHVTLNGTYYESVSGSYSLTTLVVESGVTINTLTINAGGLEIHGTVNNLVITPSEGATVIVRDCEGLSQTVYNVAKDFIAPNYKGYNLSDGKWDIALSDYWIKRVIAEPDGFVKDDASKTIRISTPEGLAWLSRNTQTNSNYCSGYTILLDDNIDLGIAYWTPIKIWAPENKTSFDGQGHTISNLKLEGSSTNDLSLFGSCAMNIKNFILDGVTITGANGYTGAVVGHLYGDLEKITVKNANITAGYWGIGGIVGFHNSGNMTDCHVIDSRINGGCPGGLTGVYNETDGRVYSNCSAENVILHDTSCWGAPYLYGSIIAVVNNTIEFVSCSSSNMTYIFGSNEPYHSGDEGRYITAPAHRLFGSGSEIIIDGEPFVQPVQQ